MRYSGCNRKRQATKPLLGRSKFVPQRGATIFSIHSERLPPSPKSQPSRCQASSNGRSRQLKVAISQQHQAADGSLATVARTGRSGRRPHLAPAETFDAPCHGLVGHAPQLDRGEGNGCLVQLTHVCVSLAKNDRCDTGWYSARFSLVSRHGYGVPKTHLPRGLTLGGRSSRKSASANQRFRDKIQIPLPRLAFRNSLLANQLNDFHASFPVNSAIQRLFNRTTGQVGFLSSDRRKHLWRKMFARFN